MELGHETQRAVAANFRFRLELRKGSMMRSAIVVLLAAMSLVFCGCFQDDPAASPASSRQAPRAGLKAVRNSSSIATTSAAPEPGTTVYSSREFSSPSRDYIPSPQQLDLPQVFAPDTARHLVGTTSAKTFTIGTAKAGSNRLGGYRMPAAALDLAGLTLNAPFESLFASLMNRRDAPTGKEDLPNPFTEARKSIAAEKAQPATPASSSPAAPQTETPKDAPQTPPAAQNTPDASAMGISRREASFVFLGDFDGSGILKYASAKRSGDAAFSFNDASRSFIIFSNPAAVESQRSFTVEDMDGDGNMDLLQTSRNLMFGRVFLGDGSGNLVYSNYFLSGFEPVVAVPGPMGSGGREILSVNLRTGTYTVFVPRGIYLPCRQGSLGFVPDYLARLVQLGTGVDYLSASQTGDTPHLYQWLNGNGLTETSETLPAQPALSISLDQQFDGGSSSTQVYQTGSYASVVLTNNLGQTFNVANMRITPQIFLVFGDIARQGSLDVGVAFIVSSTPTK